MGHDAESLVPVALTREELVLICNRQAELLKHVRDVIMNFNPAHYFIEQHDLLTKGQNSLWSEVVGLRNLRDSHEESIAKYERKVTRLTMETGELKSQILQLTGKFLES